MKSNALHGEAKVPLLAQPSPIIRNNASNACPLPPAPARQPPLAAGGAAIARAAAGPLSPPRPAGVGAAVPGRHRCAIWYLRNEERPRAGPSVKPRHRGAQQQIRLRLIENQEQAGAHRARDRPRARHRPRSSDFLGQPPVQRGARDHPVTWIGANRWAARASRPPDPGRTGGDPPAGQQPQAEQPNPAFDSAREAAPAGLFSRPSPTRPTTPVFQAARAADRPRRLRRLAGGEYSVEPDALPCRRSGAATRSRCSTNDQPAGQHRHHHAGRQAAPTSRSCTKCRWRRPATALVLRGQGLPHLAA